MRIETQIPISVGFIKEALGFKSSPHEHKHYVSAICTDSEKINGGELFIGLKGELFDGSSFIPKIKDSVLCSIGSLNSEADIRVSNTGDSLLCLAKAYKKLLPIKKTVTITGSVGKTTTKNLLSNLLKTKFITHSTYKNFNNEVGVPFTIFSAPQNTEMLILEAGMNHIGELKRISYCIEPDISVITKIGSAHIGNFGSRSKIADAKCEILSGMKNKFAIIPYAEELLTSHIEHYKTVSLNDTAADYCLLKKDHEKYIFKYHDRRCELKLCNIEHANFHISECLAFALSVCCELGMSDSEIENSTKAIDFAMLSNKKIINDLTIIDDSYNSSPEAAMEALKALSLEKTKKSVLLGDMLELGEFSEKLHFQIGLYASKCNLENIYLIGEFAQSIYDGAVSGGFDKNRIFMNKDVSNPEFTANQIHEHSSDEVILFKASHKIKLERIINILEKAKK